MTSPANPIDRTFGQYGRAGRPAISSRRQPQKPCPQNRTSRRDLRARRFTRHAQPVRKRQAPRPPRDGDPRLCHRGQTGQHDLGIWRRRPCLTDAENADRRAQSLQLRVPRGIQNRCRPHGHRELWCLWIVCRAAMGCLPRMIGCWIWPRLLRSFKSSKDLGRSPARHKL
jgi:hypothetical protein